MLEWESMTCAVVKESGKRICVAISHCILGPVVLKTVYGSGTNPAIVTGLLYGHIRGGPFFAFHF